MTLRGLFVLASMVMGQVEEESTNEAKKWPAWLDETQDRAL